MADKYLSIEIATPSQKVDIGKAKSCSAPGILGRFQVLPDHSAMVSELGVGEVKIELINELQRYAVSGGFLEVTKNRVLLLLETAEAATEIDVGRAEQARDRARQRLDKERDKADVIRAESALTRAINRIKVAHKAPSLN